MLVGSLYEVETYDGCSCVDTHPAYNADGQYTAPVLLFAFLIGLQCCECPRSLRFFSPILAHVLPRSALTLSSAIEAGVSTM